MAFLPLLMITLSNLCAARKPNILFMLADDIGWSDISYYGEDIKTPYIDSLFKTGIELTNYYTHPTCSPTRSSILTGLYSFQNGLQWLDTIPPGSAEHIPFQIRGTKVSTMMELLRDEFNFANEMIGKWHLGYASWNDTPTGRGFDNHYGFFQDAQDYFNHTTLSPKPDVTGHPQVEGYDFWDNKKDIHQAVQHDYSTGLFENRFTKVITNYANLSVQNRKPLFMYLPFQTVHTPSREIGHNMDYSQCNNITSIDRQRYCDKIVRLDLFIGTIIETYKNYSLWDDTLVVLTSDNGGMPYWSNQSSLSQGVAVSRGCNMPYRAGKATLYEGGVKSFGVINGGRNIIPDNRRGHIFSGLMHSIDWLPTIYHGLLGGSPINTNNITRFGLDLWDQIISNKISNSTLDRTLFLDIEANGAFAGVRQGDYKYFTGRHNHPNSDCLVFEDKTLGPCLLYHGYYPCNQSAPYDTDVHYETHFLYNIRKDPFEHNNLARDPKYGDLVANFNRTIHNFVKSDDYTQEQSSIFHPESMPDFHNGTWAPWL